MATLLSQLALTATVDTARLLATARGTPLFATSAQDARTLDSLVAEATAAPAYSPPAWPRDAEMLCGNWRLITTTNGRTGGPVLPLMDAQPDALGAVSVRQRLSRSASGLRCDNVITIARPAGGILSAWTLLPVGGQSSLNLQHRAMVLSESPLRLGIVFDRVTLDANRRGGEAPEEIVSLPVLSLPGFGGMSEEGTFDVVYLDDRLRVTRGGGSLRIFERDTQERCDRSGRAPEESR